MPKKKVSKARKRIRALKHTDPTSLNVAEAESEWAQFEPAEYKNAPHSFIIYRGKVGRCIKELMGDIRNIMEPYTASNLKMTKGNVLKDYVSIASYFHVTHMCVLSRTTVSPYLKICRIPRGPSLTFRILQYSLSRDVLSALRKPVTYEMQFQHHPLLILNNFSGEGKHLEIMAKTFQNMFPSININKVQLRSIRRVLMLNYNEEDDTVDLRQYTITYRPVGVSRGIKKLLLVKNHKIPNLGRCQDISEFITKDGDGSESEAEETTETVDLTQKLAARGTKGVDEVAIKLVELGPRLKLQLIKVEEGLLEGEILYHKLEEKTDEEKLAIRRQRAQKQNIKQKRKRSQEQNISKKQRERELHRKKCLEGMGIEVPDDDAEWYRQEVGEDPDADTFAGPVSSRPPKDPKFQRKRKGDKWKVGRGGPTDGKRPRISKFTKVKEKAKLLKKERQKHSMMGRGTTGRGRNASSGGGTGFKKGSGVYSKPKKSGMRSKKK